MCSAGAFMHGRRPEVQISRSQLSSLVGSGSFVQPSLLTSFHSLHQLLNLPSTPSCFHYSLHLSFPVHLQYLLFFSRTVSTSIILISLWAAHRFPTPLLVSRLSSSATHHQLNKPPLLPSLCTTSTLAWGRLCMFFFCSTWRARGKADTKASMHCARHVPVLVHDNTTQMERFPTASL